MRDQSARQSSWQESERAIPEALALIAAVINTHLSRSGREDWQNPEQLRAWLSSWQLADSEQKLAQGDLRKMLEVREALLHLARLHNGVALTPEQLERYNHLSSHAPLILQFGPDGQADLVPDITGVDGIISLLLSSAFTAMQDGTWQRFKVCRNEHCNRAFYDRSKNNSRVWCSMQRCGNSIKAQSYRQRQQQKIAAARPAGPQEEE